jgi:N-acetyl-alpha-D-glucosaminyl L-malate synthase BshA
MRSLAVGITCYPSVGGSGIVASQLGSELATLGHKVHFISYEPPFRLDRLHKNVTFHKVELNEYGVFKYPDYTLPLAVKMVEVADKFKLDILHVHYAVPHATAALLATQIAREQSKHAARLITTLHGTDITLLGRDPNLRPIIKYSIEASDGVTAVSQSLRRETNQVLKTRKPIQVIYNFFRPKAPGKSRREVRRELRIKESDFLLIHMSNLRPVKRIPDVLQVLAELRDLPGVKLLLLAGAPFDEYRPLVKKLGVARRLVVLPRVMDIENYIHASDAGLYASEKESFGMGVLETMSYGKPVVATRVGGVAEIVVNGQCGYLNKMGDVASMTNAVRKLAADRELAARLGENARRRAAEHFSPQKSVQQYVALYRQTCGEHQ